MKKAKEHLLWFLADLIICTTVAILLNREQPILSISICSLFSFLAGMQLMRWIDVNKPKLLEK